MEDTVLVLNLDPAASRLAARKLRAEKIFCRILPASTPLSIVEALAPRGVILAGGVTGQLPAGVDGRLMSAGLPILAMGDAASLLLNTLGGEAGDIALRGVVLPLSFRESPLTAGIENGERLIPCARAFRLPPEAKPICEAEGTVIGFAMEEREVYGVQFQPEQNDIEGAMLLRNFALSVCGCQAWWDEEACVRRAEEEIRAVVGEGRALCSMTGGTDSAVSALLAYRALGSRLQCIFVDTGLLRDRESQDFLAFYRDKVGMDIVRVPAEDRFIDALKGVVDPAQKRRVISGLMHTVLLETAQSMGHFDAVIRGTSLNDVLSGTASPRLLPDESVPELRPIRELFKDEIRRVGEGLGIPPEIVSRQPFPGSGLALRILGEVTRERLQTLRAADALFSREVRLSGADKRLWQYFAVLAPMPEEENKVVIGLRAVHASDRGPAYAARLPYDLMENVTERLLRERPEIARVVYDLTPSSHYAGIEWQ